jgi:hypothetical protein
MKAENIVRGSSNNIVKAYNKASLASHSEGQQWYQDAYNIAKQISAMLDSDDIRIGAGILSALSPQMEWGDNVTEAIKLATTGKAPRQTRANEDKAILIASGHKPEDILGGEKVVAFYHAIVNPTGNYCKDCGKEIVPVIDRHAQQIYRGAKIVTRKDLSRSFGNKKVMHRIQRAYVKAGKVLGIHPNIVQAVTWIQHRKDKGIVKETAWSV